MVQYNKCVVTDSGTYSIDYFTFDFLLLNSKSLIRCCIYPTLFYLVVYPTR